MTISGKFYLLGHPIQHSKSPAMYNAAFDKLEVPWTYGLADYEDVDKAVDFLHARSFLGINITTPYKPQAYEAATVRAASARLAQGANVLVSKDGELIAYNVDGEGCVGYLERIGVSFDDVQVVVCGTGPTALAIVHAAAQAGARKIVLVGRDKDRARKVLESYANEFKRLASATIDLPSPVEHHLSFCEAYDHVQLEFGSYATSTQAIAAADIIIDATPLGMKEGDPAPFDTSLLSSHQTVLDVVYGHGVTTLVEAAKTAGCRVTDGSGMLVSQAVATIGIYCDIFGVDLTMSNDSLFDVFSKAAGFDLPSLD